jgi:predicted oxidoreductase (fatty acid repression mutant protein)
MEYLNIGLKNNYSFYFNLFENNVSLKNNFNMNLLVIGHSVADIIDYMGVQALKPGGIFYSISALNNFKENQDKISLITSIDEKHYFLFKDEYKKPDEKIFNRVENIPRVHLKIKNNEERQEMYENVNQNLLFNITNYNLYDGILINMVTGFDIKLEQLKHIRKNYNGLIYFDVHTFSRGLNDKMERYFRPIPHFSEWASNLDIVQVNQKELFTLSGNNEEEEIINEIFSYGIKYLVLTLESEGAKIFFNENDGLKTIYEPAIKINVKNKIGCGDVFGSVFFYSYIKHKNINIALKLANIAAGFVASYEDQKDFKNLKDDVFARYN